MKLMWNLMENLRRPFRKNAIESQNLSDVPPPIQIRPELGKLRVLTAYSCLYDSTAMSVEGSGSQGSKEGQSYLFNCNNADELLRYYCECYQKVQLNFSPLDSRGKERGFGVNEQAAIRQTIALHWMYFYLVNSLPVELTADDLAHPDTWQFVIIASESKYGRGTPQAIRIAAHVLGTTALQVQNCIDAEEHFSSIW